MELVSINSYGTLMKVTWIVGQTPVTESESMVEMLVCVTQMIRWMTGAAVGKVQDIITFASSHAGQQ